MSRILTDHGVYHNKLLNILSSIAPTYLPLYCTTYLYSFEWVKNILPAEMMVRDAGDVGAI